MGHLKLIIFRIAAILALLIVSGVFFFLFYFIFNEKGIKIHDAEDMLYVVILLFFLITGIIFQIQNIGLIAYAEKEDSPLPPLLKYHIFLLICDAFSTIGIGIVLYSMVLEFYRQPPSLIILWFCSIWFFSNIVSIIGSLNLRTYLRIRQIRKDRTTLENIGKDVI